jgi:arginase
VETLPNALLDAGLAERLGAERFGRIGPPPYDPRRDTATKLLNPQGIADYSRALADAIARARGDGKFPVVLGGDCSILLGCMLATRRDRRAGLLFLDGHADFYQPEVEPNGEAASMELALATGRGPEIVTDLEGLRPLVREEDVVALGCRDAEQAEKHGSQRIKDTDIEVIDLAAFRRAGATAAAQKALIRLKRTALDGFWIPSRCRRARRRGDAGRGLSLARWAAMERAVFGAANRDPVGSGARHRHHDLQP